MHGDDDLTFAPLMFVLVKAAAALGQPFPKCGAFHCFTPTYRCVILYAHCKLRHNAKILERFVDLRQAPNESKKCAPICRL
jgi:hypothetical protein